MANEFVKGYTDLSELLICGICGDEINFCEQCNTQFGLNEIIYCKQLPQTNEHYCRKCYNQFVKGTK